LRTEKRLEVFQPSLPTDLRLKSLGTVGRVGSKEPWGANRPHPPGSRGADFQPSLPTDPGGRGAEATGVAPRGDTRSWDSVIAGVETALSNHAAVVRGLK
jgi:hypothetical protein